MRWIESTEATFSATDIAEAFALDTGIELHPTNVGQIAVRLDLDYVERDDGGKAYGELDLPRIYAELQALADRRAAYEAT